MQEDPLMRSISRKFSVTIQVSAIDAFMFPYLKEYDAMYTKSVVIEH